MRISDNLYIDAGLVMAVLLLVTLAVSTLSDMPTPVEQLTSDEEEPRQYIDADKEMDQILNRDPATESADGEGESREATAGSESTRSQTENGEQKETEGDRWTYIILHHSGTEAGTVEGFDRYQREEIGFERGIKYHFVIGNGNGLGNGTIEPTHRWEQQISGPQVGKEEYDSSAIGICLVGNLNESDPTEKQMEYLMKLLHALVREYDISPENIRGARELTERFGSSPGTHVDLTAIRSRLKNAPLN